MPYNEVRNLTNKHRNLAKMLVAGQHSQQEIARRMKISPPSISRLKKDPKMIDLMAKLRRKQDQMEAAVGVSTLAQARSNLDRNAYRATERLAELIDSTTEPVALSAINSLLDRTLPKKLEAGVPTKMNINIQTINAMNGVMREAGLARATVEVQQLPAPQSEQEPAAI